MFKCEICGKVSKNREKPIRVVVEKRHKEYSNFKKEVIGKGWEIVKEIVICKECGEKND